ncbi:MAG: hypothetical protein WCK67_11495 [bacterium]
MQVNNNLSFKGNYQFKLSNSSDSDKLADSFLDTAKKQGRKGEVHIGTNSYIPGNNIVEVYTNSPQLSKDDVTLINSSIIYSELNQKQITQLKGQFQKALSENATKFEVTA